MRISENTISINVPERFVKDVERFVVELKHKEMNDKEVMINCNKVAKFWDEHLDFINQQITENPDVEKACFSWKQLVRQEISMWAQINYPVRDKEFRNMCTRRGFDESQKQFIADALTAIGLNELDKYDESD